MHIISKADKRGNSKMSEVSPSCALLSPVNVMSASPLLAIGWDFKKKRTPKGIIFWWNKFCQCYPFMVFKRTKEAKWNRYCMLYPFNSCYMHERYIQLSLKKRSKKVHWNKYEQAKRHQEIAIFCYLYILSKSKPWEVSTVNDEFK